MPPRGQPGHRGNGKGARRNNGTWMQNGNQGNQRPLMPAPPPTPAQGAFGDSLGVREPPAWDPDSDETFEEFKTRFDIWECSPLCRMTDEEKGLALAMRLCGEAGKKAISLGVTVLKQPAIPQNGQLCGYQHFFRILEAHFGKEKQNVTIETAIKIFSLRRYHEETFACWKLRFDRMTEKAKSEKRN